MKHQHHLLFEAAIRGEADQFEVHDTACWFAGEFQPAEKYLTTIYLDPDRWNVRLKERTHTINGWDLPAPMTEAPREGGGEYWIEDCGSRRWASKLTWGDTSDEQLYLKRGICHATEQGAVQNCKARHGVDPFAEGKHHE